MEHGKRNKIMAIVAGGAILGVGGAFTLAAWTDTEWVFAGDGADGPGVATGIFEVQQDASQPFDATGPTFADFETNPGDELTFGPGALVLVPGDVVYAPVALRSTADSVAGTLQLNAAVAATGITADDANNYLWDSLGLAVGYDIEVSGNQPPNCDAAGFASYTELTLTGTGLGATPATATQPLSAASADIAHYCFQITMPETLPGPLPLINDLQGLSVAPAWLFDATSS